MSPSPSPLLALPLVLGAACASVQKSALAPLEPLRFVDSQLSIQPASRGLDVPQFLPAADDSDESATRLLSVRVRFLGLEHALAEQLLGAQASGLISMVLPRDQAERVFTDLEREVQDFELAGQMQLALHDGQEGSLCKIDQRAFVAGYTLRSSGSVALGDPEVAVAMEGTLLVVTGRLSESGAQVLLDLRLDACVFDDPFEQIEVELSGAHVTIQEPRGLMRSLRASAQLGKDEVLLIGGANLGGAADQGGLFVLIEAEELSDTWSDPVTPTVEAESVPIP